VSTRGTVFTRLALPAAAAALLFAGSARAASDVEWAEELKEKTTVVQLEAGEEAAAHLGKAEEIIYGFLGKQGAKVMDAAQLEKLKGDKKVWAMVHNGSAAAMMEIGKKYRADVAVRGAVSVSTEKAAGIYESTAAISLKFVRAGDAEVFAALNSPRTEPSRNEGQGKSREMAVEAAAKGVTGQLRRVITNELDLWKPMSIGLRQHWEFDTGSKAALAIATHPMGEVIAAADADGKVHVLNVYTGKKVRALAVEDERADVTALAYGARGRFLAAGDSLGNVHLWDTESDKLLGKLKTGLRPVGRVAFTPDGRMLAVGGRAGRRKTLQVWDTETCKQAATLAGHAASRTGSILSLRFLNGRELLSAGVDKSVRRWDVNQQKCISTVSDDHNFVTCAAFSPTGAMVALGTKKMLIDMGSRFGRTDVEYVRVRWRTTGEELKSMRVHEEDEQRAGAVGAVIFCTKSFLVSGTGQQANRAPKLAIWDVQRGALSANVNLERGESIRDLAASKDASWIAAACGSKVRVWKVLSQWE
jgi:hypothetical protein